jgi:hypothetical protein
MQTLAKQLINEDREKVLPEDMRWHALEEVTSDRALVCTGEFVDFGAGAGDYIFKNVNRGGITCEECIERIKYFKSIKL